MAETTVSGNMSTHVEDRAAKSKKAAAKIGGEFGGIAAIVVVGGVVAVGIAAGAIAYLRQRHNNRAKLRDDKNRDAKTVENSGEICSEAQPNESCRRKEVKLAVPSSENAEEIEPPVEIVENFSDMDFSVDWMDMSKSKEEQYSPRSHFSVGASSTSIGSDSEELSEISQNNYKRRSEIDSSHMNLKGGNFNFTVMEESLGKDSSHFRQSVPDNEKCFSSGKQLMDPKIEYEESVDSFDGLEEDCEKDGRFVEEQVGENKLAVFEGWEGNESVPCNLDCQETDGTERGMIFHDADMEHERVGLEKEGESSCFEQFHVPSEGIDAEESEDSQIKDVPYKEIVGMQVFECPEEDLSLEEENGCHERADSQQDIAVVTETQLEEKIGSSEGLHCGGEIYFKDVIDLKNSEDYQGGVGHCDDKGQHRELEESEENLGSIKEQSQLETVLFGELQCAENDVHVCPDVHENEIVGSNEEERPCKKQCLQEEKFETNVGQYLQEITKSQEEPEDCIVDEAHKAEQGQYGRVDSGDSECLECKGCISHCDENGQYGEVEESKETFCPDREQRQQGSVPFKELECTETDVHDHEDGHQNDIVGANQEELLCKAQFLEAENFEFNVEQCPQKRTGSEESEDCKEDAAHRGEQYHYETVDSSHFEGLSYKGGVCHCDGVQQWEFEYSEENLCPIKEQFPNETSQSKEMECTGVDEHVRQNGQQNDIADAYEEVLLCKEQCLLEENFESHLVQCLPERTESVELEDCKEDVVHKGEPCQNGTANSKYFESLDYKEGVSHCNEKDQHRELEDSLQNFCHIKEPCWNETAQCKELEWTTVDVHVHQNGHQNEIVGACEEVLLCKEQFLKEERFESNAERSQQERTITEELENCKVDVANKGEQCQYGTVDSGDYESLDYKEGVSYCDEKDHGELQESEEKLCPIKAQRQQDTVQFKEMEYTEADVHVYQDGHQNDIVDINEEVFLCEEQCPREEKSGYNVEKCPQEWTESDKELENCKVDVDHEGEQCQNRTVDSRDFESLDYVEGLNHCDEKDQHKELEDSEENLCPIKEQCWNETAQCKEFECTEIDMRVHQDGLLNEIVGAHDKVLLWEEHCLQEEKFECYAGQCLQERTESEEFENWRVDLAHTGEQCQFETVDSGDFAGLDEDTSHENGSCQYGVLDSKDLEGVDEGASHENRSCQYGAVDLRELEDSNDGVQFEKEQFEKEMVNSKEHVDLDIGSEEKLLLQEENLKESPERIEHVSNMNVQCEENNVDLNEIKDVEGDALIFKEQCQEELFDSKESQNSVQDVLLKNEGCKEIIGESEEFELSEEEMPIIQEQCQHVTVDPLDIQDAVEDVPVKDKQCQRKISESEELENVPFSGEQYQEIGVDSEEQELSENMCSSNEPCQQDVVDPKEVPVKDNQCEREISESEELEDVPFSGEQYQEIAVDSEELEISENVHSSNEPCQQDIVDPKEVSVKDKQCQREISESEELEDVPFSGEQYQEIAVDSEELELSENVHSSNEPCQQEIVDPKEVRVKDEQCQREISESEELEDVPFSGEQYQEIAADSEELKLSKDVHSSNEPCQQDIVDPKVVDPKVLVKDKQCQREISESEELGDEPFSGEQCQEIAVDSEELQLSEDVHSSNEPCQQDIVDPKETIDLETVNQYEQCQKVDIDGRESEYPSGNALILKELFLNETDGPESSDDEDPQTNNNPDEFNTEESECFSADTLCFKEKHQHETVDKAASEDFKQDPENFPELEGVHKKKSEHLNTHTHLLNDQKEVNQEYISTTSVSESCKLVGVSKRFQVNDESTDNETNSVAKGGKNGWDPLHSLKLGSESEESKSILMQPRWHLPMKISLLVSVFALCAFLFLFASEFAKVSTSRYAT